MKQWMVLIICMLCLMGLAPPPLSQVVSKMPIKERQVFLQYVPKEKQPKTLYPEWEFIRLHMYGTKHTIQFEIDKINIYDKTLDVTPKYSIKEMQHEVKLIKGIIRDSPVYPFHSKLHLMMARGLFQLRMALVDEDIDKIHWAVDYLNRSFKQVDVYVKKVSHAIRHDRYKQIQEEMNKIKLFKISV